MLSLEEIKAGVSPLTATKVVALDWILRNSVAYDSNRAQYNGVRAKLDALKGAPASAANAESNDDAANKAKAMDTLLSIFPVEIDRGTIAKQGGDDGKDYSQVRDREDLIEYALKILFDEEEISDEPASNFVAVLPQSSGCGCGTPACWKCRGYVY